MRRAALTIAALFAVLLGGCGDDEGAPPQLTVFAASSLQTALTAYADSMPELNVRASFAGSDQLAAQIRQGAGADVFASADTSFPAQLHRDGLVEEPELFASNRLVIAVPAGSGISGLSDLAEPGTSVILGDASVPIGSYAGEALARLPTQQRSAILANVVSREPEASSITAKLVQGAADAGIVYATDVRATGTDLESIRLPAGLQPQIGYSVAVVKGTGREEAARSYVDGLIEGDGAKQLRKAGFLPPR